MTKQNVSQRPQAQKHACRQPSRTLMALEKKKNLDGMATVEGDSQPRNRPPSAHIAHPSYAVTTYICKRL